MKFEPREIIDEGDGFLIRWADETENRFDARTLRMSCACAGCINEWTGEKMLKPEMIAPDVKIEHIGIVGRYALNFHFSDGHETGIYSFKYLRELAEKPKSTTDKRR
ncbi:MAG: DUF971 domain-containing protein [Pyrinomonadaceae bacterium]